MINFNTVIDNFDRVYKAKTQKKEDIFLNSALEVVETPSEKASFFDIIAALQFRKWDLSSVDSTSSQLSRSIKKILLQTKLIYDNDPFPVKIPCKYIELLDKSIIEGVFLDPVNIKIYAEEVRKYCEILYFYKLLIEADENLSNVSSSNDLHFPPNLEKFNKSAEELFYKLLFLIQTKEFKFLTEAKYKDPLLYLSVFIEGTEEKIEKTYPEILYILQLAELVYSKEQLHLTKGKFTAQELRDKFLSILNNPVSGKIKQKNAKDKIFFMAGYNRSTSSSFNEIYKHKEAMKSYLNDLNQYISYYENEIKIVKKNLSIATEYKVDSSTDINVLKSCLEKMKGYLQNDKFAMLCFQYLPFLQIQHTYINSFRNLVTTLKTEKLGFSNTNSHQKKAPSLKKNKEAYRESIIQNLERITLEPSSFEKKVIQEHFPTLLQKGTLTGHQKICSLLRLELMNAAQIYTLLSFELDKIHAVNPSLKEKTSTISPEYVELITLLSGHKNPSLPTTEKFSEIQNSKNLESFFSAFFSVKEIKSIDQIIDTFYKQTEKNLETKLQEYSQEFIRLQKQTKAPIKRPKAVSKDFFIASTSQKNELDKPSSINCGKTTKLQLLEDDAASVQQKTSISENEILPSAVASTSEKKDIIDKQEKKLSLSSASIERYSETEKDLYTQDEEDFLVVKSIKKKKTNFKHRPLSVPLKEETPKTVVPITSLKMLPSVTAEQKNPTIIYINHVSRWFSDREDALNDPKYAGFNLTKSERKESVVYHAFPTLIDSLLNTNYSLKKVDPNDSCIIRYGIPGTISLDGKKHHGIFEYTINADNICFHRCFSRKTDNFEKIQPLTVSKGTSQKTKIKHFSFGKTPVQLNLKKQEITIMDYKMNAEFTIVHPDNYWKLPNKITNIS